MNEVVVFAYDRRHETTPPEELVHPGHLPAPPLGYAKRPSPAIPAPTPGRAPLVAYGPGGAL